MPCRQPRRPPSRPPSRPKNVVPAEAVANRVAVSTATGLALLLGLPKLVLPVSSAILLLIGLIAGGIVGMVLLLAVAGVLAWLLVAFWPVTPPRGRMIRVIVVLGIAVVGVLKAA